jgi:RNA polymerase subunit RPABC4/transcription elongation factor Spt4
MDYHEHACFECKGIFYTEWYPVAIRDMTAPQFCPFCGVKFTHTWKTEGEMV